MKSNVFIISLLFCAVFTYMPVHAAKYTDDMISTVDDGVKQYNNLTDYSFSHMAPHVPDATALSFSNITRPAAWVTYRVNGASEVTAGIYSIPGTFSILNQQDSTYYLGMQENMPSGTRLQAFYSAASNAVYLNSGASGQAYTDGVSYYKFGPVITPPQGALTGYGINFYCSYDGKNFTRLASARQTKLQYSTVSSLTAIFCYEEYTAAVPSGVKYVRVEINDVTSLPLEGGGVITKTKKTMTALASATFTGDSLVMGEPLPQQQESSSSVSSPYFEPEIRAESSTKAKEESEKTFPAQADPKIKQEGESGKSSSSKFEGTITSSQKSSRSASSQSSKSGASSSKKPKTAESAPESEEPRDETIIYEIRREEGGERFSGAITAYIVIVTAALFLVVLMPKKK